MKKLIPILIILAGAGYGAYYYYGTTQVVEKPTITKVTVSTGTVTEAVQTTGTLEALRTFNVGSQVSGVVQDVFVDFNSIVKKDQLIATIDPQLLEVQVALQNANVERQKGEIAIQEVQLEDAIKQQERTKQMAEKGLSTAQQLDASVLTVKQRMTSLDSARKQLLTAEANLNQAKLNVSYTKIYSPVDGVVINRLVDTGRAVQASMTTPQFFLIAHDLRTLKLSAGVDEAEIGKIRRDMRVLFTVESYPGTTFEGTVEAVRLNATANNNVVTYPVWINVPNPDLRLKPSMTASARIIIQTVANVTRVPNQALRFRPTSDMYTALGLTPPAAGQGRALAGGPNAGRGGDAAAAQPGAAAQGQRRGGGEAPAAGAQQSARAGQAALEGGQARQGGQARPQTDGAAQGRGGQVAGRGQQAGGGQGRAGGRGDFANMTPEQRQQMLAQRGGGAGGGRGGGRGRGGPSNTEVAPIALDAEKIDDLYPVAETRTTNGQVWTWDDANKKLTEIRVVTGLNDGQFSQLVSGEITVGQELLSQIVLPLTAAQRQQQSIFGAQPGGRQGFGGPQQGGGGGQQGGQQGGGGRALGGLGGAGGGGGGGRGGF